MTADPCLMPVAGDRLCYLPGDHDGGCTPLPPYTRKPVTLPDGTPVVFWSSPAPVADEQCAEEGPDPDVCAGCDHQRAFHYPQGEGICLGHCDCVEFEVAA